MKRYQHAACICITADRPSMTARVIDCFTNQQALGEAELYIYDSSKQPLIPPGQDIVSPSILMRGVKIDKPRTIGELRNGANAWAVSRGANIILHWDSDDWYHPNYLKTQIARLKAVQPSGVGCVGYREALFFETRAAEAWKYHHASESYAIGASFCYWASCWDRVPFEATSKGEDSRWLRSVRSRGFAMEEEPLMIATIHGDNTSTSDAFLHRHNPHDTSWSRASQLDAYCIKALDSRWTQS